ncbi:UPF0496 protein 1-like [Zingiber officinale]|uniref:UPF0496 protein 1-like n=1 Tax=Zingiber officinale TaxID=94328 RepID=UPI001C4B440C|nr:UPF0496 protein 1-like [Zingiber officinale]
MGCSISRRSRSPPDDAVVGNATGSPAASSSVSHVDISVEMNSYEEACILDQELKTFEVPLQERMNLVLDTLAVGDEVPSLSFDNLRAATADLLEMNQEAYQLILKQKDILKNADLINDCLDDCLLTIHFWDTLQSCLDKASESQSIIRSALQRFTEDDAQEADQGSKQKYARTLDELRRFKAAGNPITKEFSHLCFRTLHKQHETMLEKLRSRKENLKKELKTLTTSRRVSKFIFVSVFAAAISCSVVLEVAAARPVATAMGLAAAMPIPMGNLIDFLLEEYQKSLGRDGDVVKSIEHGLVEIDMSRIPSQVERLEMHIKSMLEYADFVVAKK